MGGLHIASIFLSKFLKSLGTPYSSCSHLILREWTWSRLKQAIILHTIIRSIILHRGIKVKLWKRECQSDCSVISEIAVKVLVNYKQLFVIVCLFV